MLPEELPLYERLTGEEYLHFAGRMYGLGREETRRRTEELLSFLTPRGRARQAHRGLLAGDAEEGWPWPRPSSTTRGCCSSTSRSTGSTRSPAAWSPTSLRRLAGKGVTLFFTTHVLDVVERLCDEVAIIDHGRLDGAGHAWTRSAPSARWLQDASLEDVFLKLVSADVRREDLSWIG